MGPSCGKEPCLAGEQLLHYRLFEVMGLIAAGLQRRQFGVHIRECGSDRGLFGEFWNWNRQSSHVTAVNCWVVRPCEQSIDLPGHITDEQLVEDKDGIHDAFATANHAESS